MVDSSLKVAFHTLGCKLNFSESSSIGREMMSEGYQKVSFDQEADIYFIHGCTVTESADRKCRQLIKQTIRRAPDSLIIVAGCYAQLRQKEIEKIEGVDLILGTNEKYSIVDFLNDRRKRQKPEIHNCELNAETGFNPAFSGNDRTRSFLKIQDGCDYSCSYCTIPAARGESRNQTIDKCVDDARKIADTGTKEVVLTGVNIGDFGKSTGESFTDLLRAIIKVDGIERIRMSSIEPNLLNKDIIKLVAEEKKLLQHFHIPLQSGSDYILGKMRRRYKRKVFESVVRTIRETMPLAGIGADVITGFPGEQDKHFRETYDFLQSLDLSYLHVFSFSKRSGTVAASMDDQVDKTTKQSRSKRLQSLSEDIQKRFASKCVGMQAEILWESQEKPGYISGFTGNYLKVYAKYNGALKGKITVHTLEKTDENGNFTV